METLHNQILETHNAFHFRRPASINGRANGFMASSFHGLIDSVPTSLDGRNVPEHQLQPSRNFHSQSIRGSSLETHEALTVKGARTSIARIQIMRSIRDEHCNCSCHSYSRFRSPNFLDSVLGSLFIGYQNSPWLMQACNNLYCRSHCRSKSKRTLCTYTFPAWLLRGVVMAKLSHNSSRGPELCLRVMRIRDDIDNIFSILLLAQEELIVAEVKRQLDAGETSVLDVSLYGCTLLHVRETLVSIASFDLLSRNTQLAIIYNLCDVVRLLVCYGADIHHEDTFGR